MSCYFVSEYRKRSRNFAILECDNCGAVADFDAYTEWTNVFYRNNDLFGSIELHFCSDVCFNDGANPRTALEVYRRREREWGRNPDRFVKGVECPKCKEQIWSRHQHDFRHCKCKNIFVDGGRAYLRYGGADIENIKIVFIDTEKQL